MTYVIPACGGFIGHRPKAVGAEGGTGSALVLIFMTLREYRSQKAVVV